MDQAPFVQYLGPTIESMRLLGIRGAIAMAVISDHLIFGTAEVPVL